MAASKSNHRASIAAIRARQDIDESEKRRRMTAVRVNAHIAELPERLDIDGVTASDFRAGVDGFSCVLSASGRKFNNPFVFHNPPLLVPDPDGDVEIGDAENPRRMREDVPAALRQMLVDAIKR